MIYLFDRAKKLQKIIPRKHIINATQTKVRNGIYQLAVEVPIFYETKQGTQYNYQKSVGKATFAGHYDVNNKFQLYKIYSRNITANEQGEFLLFDGVHIFFDEAKAMGNIHDRRFRDSEAKDPADAAFNSIGWHVIDYDVTDRHDINFYRASVTDAWNDLISTYGVEFDYELQFDGRKIISKNIIMKKQIGKWTGQRFAYGTNVLTLTQEQDESEVYTAAVGRGRGEESGDGFGPRLEFGDIAWSKDGITKPVGQNYIELPSATAEYGFIENGIVKPRIAPEVVFEDIEDKRKLADATYYWLLENCLPKATWKTEVARIGNLNLGDTVGVLYKSAGIIKRARVEKIEYNLLDPALSKLTLGDFHHFENRQMKRINAEIKRLGRDNRSLISQAKDEFNQWFNDWVTAFENQLAQAKIDIFAEIEADRERMENEWQEQWNTGMSEIQNGIKEAERKATENAIRIENDIKSDLDQLTQDHGSILEGLLDDVMDIDEFLGTSRSITLDQRFLDISQNFEERLRKVDSNTFNMIRGTRFDEPDMFHLYSSAELQEEGNIKFVTLYSERFNEPRVHFTEGVTLEKGKKYIVAVDYRSYGAKELDRLAIGDMDGYYNLIDDIDKPLSDLHTDGKWRRTYGTVIPSETVSGEFQIGTNFASGDVTRERIDIKLVYLTGSNNTDWVYHPQDATQSIEEITRRVNHLEDGYSEFVTKSRYDAETDTLNQYIKSVEQTVEGNELILQRVEDWQATNGQSVLETVDAYERKLWLNDFADIGANLIPQSSSSWENGSYWSTGVENNSLPENIRLRKDTGVLVAGDVMHTFSDRSIEASNIRSWMILQLGSDGRTVGEPIYCPVGREITFRTTTNRLVFTAYPVEGKEVRLTGLNNRIKTIYVKLERGSSATPMLNAISHIEQLADEISMQVQSLDGTFLKQTDFKLTPDYWQLGALRIGAEDVSNVLRGSPDAIDAVVSEFNLTGNLNAKGQITSLAVDAIEGNFARLFTARLNANVITTDHISGLSAEFQRMYILNANIERLVAQNVFTRNVKALSIEAVEGQFSSLMTKYLNANYIDVNYINGKNAWFETQYVKTSNISNLTSQNAFIRDIQTIEVTANQLNINTLQSKLKGVEGGLTIYGPDGRVLINNSILENTFSIGFIQPRFMGVGVELSANYFKTTNTSYTTAAAFSFQRGGRYLTIEGYCEMRSEVSGSADTTVGAIRLMEYSSGSRSAFTMIESRKTNNNDNQFFRIRLDLGVPQYEQRNFYVQFYTAHPGNGAYFRINQAYYHG